MLPSPSFIGRQSPFLLLDNQSIIALFAAKLQMPSELFPPALCTCNRDVMNSRLSFYYRICVSATNVGKFSVNTGIAPNFSLAN